MTPLFVPAGHLIAHGYLPALSQVDPYYLIGRGRQLAGVFSRKHLDVNHNARLAVRNFKRRVPDFPGLLSKYGPQQPLLSRLLRVALRRNSADEYVARMHLRAYADYAVVVEVGQQVLADARDIAGDLLGAQLGLLGVDLVFFYMDGRIEVFFDQPLVEKHCVLIVVALPGHKAYEHIAAQRQLAVVGRRTVGQHLALDHALSGLDDNPCY